MIFVFQTWLNRKSFLVEVIILKLINAPHLLDERKSGDHILEQYLEWLYRLVLDSQFKVLKFINMTNSKLDWKLFSKDLQFISTATKTNIWKLIENHWLREVTPFLITNAIFNCLDSTKLSRALLFQNKGTIRKGTDPEVCKFRFN